MRYSLAIFAVVLATVFRLALDPILDTRFPFATLFFAVLVTAWLGGFGPALLASACGLVAAIGFLMAPRHQLRFDDLSTIGGLALYLAVSVGIALIGGGMHRARRRVEAEAHAAHARREELRVALQSIGDAVITTDVEGRVETLNPVAASLTGWTPEAAAGQPVGEVFRSFDEITRDPTRNPVKRALEEGRVVRSVSHEVMVDREGNERPIDDSAAPIRDQGGVVTGSVLVFRDVSERRRAEALVRESEEELSDLFENASVGIHWVAADGTILRANRAELEMLGYSHGEYVGHHVSEFHEDPQVIADILERLGAGETLQQCRSRMRCKDGTLKEVSINASGRWDRGEFLHSRCFTIDVSDSARIDEAQALLAAVVQSSDDAIATKTLDGIITSWNAGAERLFGYPAAEAIGRPILMIIPPDRHDEERHLLERLRRGERIDPFETVRVTKSGERVEISLRVSPVRDRDGRIIGVSKLARDIGAPRRAERALRESEERFRTLADNIAQLAWMADGSGWTFWYNQRWFRYTGTSLEDVQGWGWRTLHHPDHVERVVEKITRCFQTGEVWEDTFPLRGADGRYRWFLSRAVPIRDAEGRVTLWFGTNTDITDQREAEEALRAADQQKDQFIATLAHELRNPLAPIRSSVDLMKLADGDEELIGQARTIIDRQMSHLERLVDDLLEIARIRSDRLHLRRETVAMAAIVDQVVETCQPLVEAAGVELTVDVSRDPLPVYVDPVRMGQVLTNLLNNACKFSHKGGRVWLEARREDDDHAVVRVRDTGRGIPPDMLNQVFDMWSQLDPPDAAGSRGLGIGLSLVKRLVEMHDGTVEARSEGRGCGSEFIVRVPLAREVREAPAAPATESPTEPMAPRRVLVVDDNLDAAESLATLLTRFGHTVALAHDGETALRKAEEFRPDVALLDIGLPKLDGYDVAQRIREKPWGRDMMLVALTGWGQEQDRRRSREVGFDHHLVKPIDVGTLKEILGRLPERPAEPERRH